MEFLRAVAATSFLRIDLFGCASIGSGDDDYVARVMRFAEAEPSVIWHGAYSSESIVSLINGFDFVVMPFSTDRPNLNCCLPNKYYQALFAGVPLVVSDMEELGAIVTESGAGVVFKSGDYEEMVGKLSEFVGAPEMFRGVLEGVERLSETVLDPLTFLNDVRELYQEGSVAG